MTEIAERTGRPYRVTVAANMTAMAYSGLGRTADALRLIGETKRRDPGYRATQLLDMEAWIRYYGGDYAGAKAAAGESEAYAPGAVLRRLVGIHIAALANVELGDLEEARRLRDRAAHTLGDRDWQFHRPLLLHVDGLLQWADRRSEEAVGSLVAAMDRMLTAGGMLWVSGLTLLELAELGAEREDPSLATFYADAARTLAATSSPPFVAIAHGATAWAALAEGRPDVAVARAAVGEADRSEWRALQARTRHVLGRTLAGVDPAESAAVLEDAARRFADCGAVWRRERVLDALRRSGSAGRRALAAAGGPSSLTRREREVAELAAQGLSAKEIAAALFVGERTVETHLSNLYAKLGVESKLDLVRRAAELGLA